MISKFRSLIQSAPVRAAALGVVGTVAPLAAHADPTTGPGGVDYAALATSFTTAITPIFNTALTPAFGLMALFMAPMVIRKIVRGFAH